MLVSILSHLTLTSHHQSIQKASQRNFQERCMENTGLARKMAVRAVSTTPVQEGSGGDGGVKQDELSAAVSKPVVGYC